jgi:hypothetical protein
MADLYEVLGVPADANEDAIRRAYRAAARREHPDVSRHPDAAGRMTELNRAYAVLGDPAARAGYDRYRRMPQPAVAPAAAPAGPANYPWLRCERCGAETDDLRFRVFLWVVSALLRTWRRTTPGLFCGRCRRRLAWNRSLASLLLGPWGIPYGPFATVGAVWRNARGGHADPMVDANFEAHMRQAGRRGSPAANGAAARPRRRGRRVALALVLVLLVLALTAAAVMLTGAADGVELPL